MVCPASLREMWQRELAGATIAAQVVGMEELGRDTFDASPYSDADVILLDESHNFRNDKANRYLALDTMIQLNGGRGRDGEQKKVILLSATPINNDLYDLANQIRLFTQSRPDYFREAGIGDFNAYFRRARRMVQARGRLQPGGVVLFNLLEEVMVRNTRPYIRAAYPNATIKGKPVAFPNRRLHTVEYDLWCNRRRSVRRDCGCHRLPLSLRRTSWRRTKEIRHQGRGTAQIRGRPRGRAGRHSSKPRFPEDEQLESEHRGIPP